MQPQPLAVADDATHSLCVCKIDSLEARSEAARLWSTPKVTELTEASWSRSSGTGIIKPISAAMLMAYFASCQSLSSWNGSLEGSQVDQIKNA